MEKRKKDNEEKGLKNIFMSFIMSWIIFFEMLAFDMESVCNVVSVTQLVTYIMQLYPFTSQQIFICSKSTTDTLEKSVNPV